MTLAVVGYTFGRRGLVASALPRYDSRFAAYQHESPIMPSYHRAFPLSELPAGTAKSVEIEGKSILLCNDRDTIYAVSNICSHADEKLECGRMRSGWIACPIHGARFELATGRAMNPPATQPIATYPSRVADGWIEVEV